jgi:hypothetical protein
MFGCFSHICFCNWINFFDLCACVRRYYPPVSSERALTSAWDQAPAAEGVTILFTFLEGASQLKSMGKKIADDALWRLQSVVCSIREKIHDNHEFIYL